MTTTLEQLVALPVAQIVANPEQPRRKFDEQVLAELADSLRQHGVLEPLIVRPLPDGSWQIIAGERRWRASKLAGLVTVPCRVMAGLTDDEAFILSATENVARQDMTVMEEARAYARIVAMGKTVEEVAALFGKRAAAIGWRLELLALDGPIAQLVDAGQLGRNLAWYLSRLSREGQYDVLRRLNAGEFANDEAACQYAMARQKVEAQPALLAPVAEPPEASARRREQRDRWERSWLALDRFGETVLRDVAEATPEELVRLIAGRPWTVRLELLRANLTTAIARLTQAEALVAAMTGKRMGDSADG